MTKEKVIPQIRFSGFTDTWEQHKLGEFADIVGGGTPSTSNFEYWDGDIDWYAPAEIADQIFVSSSERKITQQGYDNSSAKMLPVGTVLFTSRAGIGKTAILRKEGCTNQGFQSIVPHINELDSYFIFSRSEEMKRYGETVGAGSTFVEVSGKQMANMELMMPTTMEEQVTIGSFFRNLDSIITLHQRKYDKLTKVKKAMLEKMFPENGSPYPEIRFKGFTDAWEQRKFQDIFSFERPDNYIVRSDKYSNEYTMPVLTANKAFVLGYTKENSPCTKTSLIFDDFTLECKYVDFPYMVKSSAIKILTVKDSKKDNLRFSFERLNTTKIEILGHARHYISVVQPTETRTPEIAEQNKISAFFSNLDNLITLHQRERLS